MARLCRPLPLFAAVAIAALSAAAPLAHLDAPNSRIVFSGWIVARGSLRLSIPPGLAAESVLVQGNGSTDFDCWLYDASGSLVDADTQGGDRCELRTAGRGAHRLIIRNYGLLSNKLVVSKL